jgi:tRNA dimethylallyltransferase
MVRKKPSIIIILGPTAVGKSRLAVDVARRFGGEVISADSRQVYRGLDIATGKITQKEMRGVPHHLLSMADPRRTFTAARYKKLADAAVRASIRRGKLPVICGGTGFYIAALEGSTPVPEVPPDAALRKDLSKKNPAELFAILRRLDSRRAGSIDPNNSRRLIRAIEIATALGKVPALRPVDSPYRACLIGLDRPDQELRELIASRTKKRLRRGMLAEARQLRESGLSLKRMRELGLEYARLADFLEGTISKEELAEKIERDNWHYAKRQRTWWKRDTRIRWFHPDDTKQVYTLLGQFLETAE